LLSNFAVTLEASFTGNLVEFVRRFSFTPRQQLQHPRLHGVDEVLYCAGKRYHALHIGGRKFEFPAAKWCRFRHHYGRA
jgi:hypothetical protein